MKAALLAALLSCAFVSQATPPPVTIQYAPEQDAGCPIQDSWKSELAARRPEFDRAWERDGPRMLAAVEAITGKAFAQGPVTARLTLCNTPSESSPMADRVTVNMRFALASFTRAPVSFRYKAHTVFHEMLHLFLFRHPVGDSALLRQHAAEPERVRGHLHLLALQKAVLLQLEEPDALKEIVATDTALPGGYYKRAWELVNATDNRYGDFVAELRR